MSLHKRRTSMVAWHDMDRYGTIAIKYELHLHAFTWPWCNGAMMRNGHCGNDVTLQRCVNACQHLFTGPPVFSSDFSMFTKVG